MILLDKPYVSDFLQKSLIEKGIPVIQTDVTAKLNLDPELSYISEQNAIKRLSENPFLPVYSNSENAISWISQQQCFERNYALIKLFKNKLRFRKLIQPIYPDFFYQSLRIKDIAGLDKKSLVYPLILKPAVGFFSMGVYKLDSAADWEGVEEAIQAEIAEVGHFYPKDVFDSTEFILEECIPGREFAFDGYYDRKGSPVITNIMEHIFSSDGDVGDRLYSTSDQLISAFLPLFTEAMKLIGQLSKAKNFPVHIEVRITEQGEIIPIEVNPLRFGGWCTTADLAGMAFGFNPYEMFFESKKPNWDEVWETRANKNYSIILLDNSTGFSGDKIESFDYERVEGMFENVLDMRKIDFREYPIFGFLFIENSDRDKKALDTILKSDLKEFITLAK